MRLAAIVAVAVASCIVAGCSGHSDNGGGTGGGSAGGGGSQGTGGGSGGGSGGGTGGGAGGGAGGGSGGGGGSQVNPPSAPTNLTATAGSKSVSLSWTASAGATSYEVWRQANSPFSKVAEGLTATTYVDTGLTNGQPYSYFVQAVNSGGTSGASNSATATPSDCVVLASGLSFEYLGNASTGNSLAAIATDSDRIYWFDYDAQKGVDGGALRSIPKDGGTVTVIASGLGGVNAFAIDDANIYWTEFDVPSGNGRIARVQKSGGTPVTLAQDFFPTGIAVDSNTVYFSSGPGSQLATYKVPLDGGAVTPLQNDGGFYAASLALDSNYLYGVDLTGAGVTNGRARRVLKTGGPVEVLATGLENAFAPVLDNNFVYWAEITTQGRIGRAPKTGGGATYVVSNLRDPHNVALDSDYLYFEVPPNAGMPYIGKLPLDGGTTQQPATEQGCSGLFLSVDPSRVYMSVFGNAAHGAGEIRSSAK